MKHLLLISVLLIITCEKEKICYKCRELQDKCDNWINLCDSSNIIIDKYINSELWECRQF
jgi:hypothetical protein